jgi:all-trans-retinol 13,14-reductase
VITLANWAWFEPWRNSRWYHRGADYEAFKGHITERLLEVVYRFVPQIRGHVEVAELSTPLSTKKFAGHPRGEVYGLAHTPLRFRQKLLRPATPIKGFYLTGADVTTAGVASALFAGLLTAGVILKRNLLRALARGSH